MKNKSLKVSITVFAILFGLQLNAQDRIIHGIVTTFDSISLHGAIVKVASSKQEVLTDSTGNFSVGCDLNDKLKVYADGFYTQNVKLEKSTKYAAVNLKLKAGDKNLEIATSFTNVLDRDKLSSLASMSSNDLNLSVYSNVFDAITGKFPGLQVDGTNLIVRGVGSISGPTPALIVLDGVVVHGTTLNALNPETIKSINVIKDGSSAVYGSRGAFGVVEITTKSGSDRK